MHALTYLKQNYILLAILLISVALRVYHLDFQSAWLDEIHTLNEANPALTLTEMYSTLKIYDPHPPLYFLIVKLFFAAFGYTTVVLRVVSVIMGVAGILAIYKLGALLYNKKAGYYAAIVIAVNPFHLHYSQDGRPYSMVFFVTVLSFYFLTKFIKQPTVKSAVLYGLFAGLMLYGHFIALFVLMGQCLILLYFIYKPNLVTRLKFFAYCLLAGIICTLLYLPSIPLLQAATEKTSFWIPKPDNDAYYQIFKEFFGHAKILIYVIEALVLYFIVKLFMRRSGVSEFGNKEKFTGAFILISWVVYSLLFPWIKSQISLPIIISRYFIMVLPAIVLIVAAGLVQIKRTIAYVIVGCIVILSLKNIIIDQKYYTTVTNSQFREVAAYIDKNKDDRDKVVTSLYWYFPYYLKNTSIEGSSLEDYVTKIQADTIQRAFWYADGHQRPYKLSPEKEAFLKQNFKIMHNIEFLDTWTQYYVPLKKESK